jgi:hypothetical protein
MFISKVFLFSFVCLFSVCGNSVSQTENTNKIQLKEKAELSLKMERSGCYGRCPIYDLTIQPNGKIIFEGKFWTKVKGTAEDKLTEEQLKQLTAEIEKANFFSLDNAYNYDSKNCPEIATDSPGVNLTIKLNGKEKTIDHYHGCSEKKSANQNKDWAETVFPQQLFKLENKIDEIIETKRWIGEQEY